MYHLPLIQTILFCFLESLVCPTWVYGQISEDHFLSKKDTLEQSPAHYSQVELYFQMANKSAKEDPDKAWQYLRRGKEYAGSDAYLNAKAAFYEAQILTHTDPSKAEKTYLQADKLLSPFHSKEALSMRARALNHYIDFRRRKGDYKTVLAVLTKKIIPLAKAAQDRPYLAQSYASVGHLLMEHEQYKKAEQYFEEALEQLKDRPRNGPLQLSIKLGICQNLLRSKQAAKAKLLLEELRSFIPPNTMLSVRFGLNEGMLYNKLSQPELALQTFTRAKALAEKLKQPELVKIVTYYQVRTLNLLKKHQAAQALTSKTFAAPPLIPHNKLVLYQNNADNYFLQKKYDSAYYYLQKLEYLKDSLYHTKVENEISALEIKFKSEENKNKIVALESSNLKSLLDVSQSRFYMGMLGMSTILLAALVLLLYTYLQKNKKEQAQRERVSVATALLQGQEEERKRVARDLHDDLGGTLTAIKMGVLGLVNERNLAIGEDPVNKILGQLNHSANKVRQIANNMMPEMLLKLGLEAALNDLCTYYSSDNLHIDLNYMEIAESISEQDKLTIYRIIQELLTNTVKHAQARHVLIQCSRMEHTFFLVFEDDGIGLNPAKNHKSKGLGLENIKARVAYMNGSIEIVSGGTYKGTIFNIELNLSDEISNRNS